MSMGLPVHGTYRMSAQIRPPLAQQEFEDPETWPVVEREKRHVSRPISKPNVICNIESRSGKSSYSLQHYLIIIRSRTLINYKVL